MVKDKKISLDKAADSIMDAIEAHVATLPPEEGAIRLDAFGKALSKAAKPYRRSLRPSPGTSVSRLVSPKRVKQP